MARTKQTARKSTGGKAPRKQVGQQSEGESSKEEQKQAEVSTDITYESSFYAHYFRAAEKSDKEFDVAAAAAKIRNPFTDELESWLSVHFHSKLDGDGIKKNQPKMNVVIALDISGSMGSCFQTDSGEIDYSNFQTQLDVAKECIAGLLKHLKEGDGFGMTVFDTKSSAVIPLAAWEPESYEDAEEKINELEEQGGTSLTEGLNGATDLFEKFPEDPNAFNRVFFFTDLDSHSPEDSLSFIEKIQKNASRNIWTTVVGIGVDLTQTMIQQISQTPGCNYCNVRTPDGFKELIDQEFLFLVRPLAFNIQLQITSESYTVEKAIGSYELHHWKPGNPVQISTEFPNMQNEQGENRGGIYLFKLKPKNVNPKDDKDALESCSLTLKYEDLLGLEKKLTLDIVVHSHESKALEALRKGVLLVHYTDAIQEYCLKKKEGTLKKEELEHKFGVLSQEIREKAVEFKDKLFVETEMTVISHIVAIENLKEVAEKRKQDDDSMDTKQHENKQ